MLGANQRVGTATRLSGPKRPHGTRLERVLAQERQIVRAVARSHEPANVLSEPNPKNRIPLERATVYERHEIGANQLREWTIRMRAEMSEKQDLAPALTEGLILDLLQDRHTKPGNGGSGEFVFLRHVRNAAGFDANREFDAVAMNLWPSRGLTIHVYEVKISRGDWQKELSDPRKADAAAQVADQFTVVAPPGIIQTGEVPAMWGHLEVVGDGTEASPHRIRQKRAAQYLRDVRAINQQPIDRSFAVAMLRAAPGAVPGGKRQMPATSAQLEREFQKGVEYGKSEVSREDRFLRNEAEMHRELVKAFKEAGYDGINIGRDLMDRPEQVIAALNGGKAHDTALRQMNNLERIIDMMKSEVTAFREAEDVPKGPWW